MSSDILMAKTLKEPIRKNQNYTVVPNNSQVSDSNARQSSAPVPGEPFKKQLLTSVGGLEKQDATAEKSNANEWKFSEGFDWPDEDERDEVNLVGVNTGILKDLATRNKATINDILNSKASAMKRMAFKIRT